MSNTISEKLIENPRKKWECDDCMTPIAGSYWRLYGSAERGDPPYVLRICPECRARCKKNARD